MTSLSRKPKNPAVELEGLGLVSRDDYGMTEPLVSGHESHTSRRNELLLRSFAP